MSYSAIKWAKGQHWYGGFIRTGSKFSIITIRGYDVRVFDDMESLIKWHNDNLYIDRYAMQASFA